MKRMNLLPPEFRLRDGARSGSAYVVIGALTACVIAMLVYALVLGGVRSDESDLVSLEDETAEAQARSDALSPYGAFADMKQQRERSVRTVADTRFNYERLTRELARILPEGVWVSKLDVAPAAPESEVAEAGADSPAASQPGIPAMTLSGCAPSQDVVASTLDRLRALTDATDVELGSSAKSDVEGADSSSSSSGPAASAGDGDCGEGGNPRVAFEATVTLTAPGAGQVVPATAPTGAGS